jgi:hypothetical protein
MKRTMAWFVVAATLTAAPSFSGTYFSAVTTREGRDGAPGMSITVRGWAEGVKARVEFAESNSPVLKPGLFLLTLDGGATVYLVDPKERTFSKLGTSPLDEPADTKTRGPRGVVTMTFSDLKVEKVGESDGGEIAGVATRHLRLRTRYTTEVKSLGLKQPMATVIEEDVWFAPKLNDPSLAIWLSKALRKTGDADFDAQLSAQQQNYDGFPLKRVTVTTTTDKNGKKTVSTATSTVTTLIVGEMPAGTFAMGSGYREKPIMAAPDSQEQQEAGADQTEVGQEQEQERYPFDQMLDQPQGDQPAAQPQQGQPAAQPATRPGAQPASPNQQQPQPEPEPEPEPQEQPEYPFERMLDAPQG